MSDSNKGLLTVDRIRTSDGVHNYQATPEQTAAMELVCRRVNALLKDVGVTDVAVSDGLRDPTATYGAARSAHKEGKAVDLKDRGHGIALKATRAILLKHGLRREDTRDTPTWCHFDIREPHGSIFRP